MTITHTFVNPKADGADATITRPSDWNAAHNVTPDTIANVLSDHNKAAHDALAIDHNSLTNKETTAAHGVTKIAGITIGNYVGNGAQNRAIAHGLSAVPKWIRIIKIDGSWNYDAPVSGKLYYMNDNNAGVVNVTAWDATNFYVGDAGDTDNGGNKTGGHTYNWVAFT